MSSEEIEYDQQDIDDIINDIEFSDASEKEQHRLVQQPVTIEQDEKQDSDLSDIVKQICEDIKYNLDDEELNQQQVNDILKDYDEQLEFIEKPVEQKRQMNALQKIEQKERELCLYIDQSKLDDKFVLSKNDYIKDRQLGNMDYKILEKVTNKLYDMNRDIKMKETAVGMPRTIIQAGKYIVIGTSFSYLCLFSEDQQELKILGSSQEQNYGPITSCDVSYDSQYVVVGHELGQIVLWDINKHYIIKTIQGVHGCPILAIKFYNNAKWNLLSSDSQGNLYKIDIIRSFFNYSVDKQLMLPRNQRIYYQIKVLERSMMSNSELKDYKVIGLQSVDIILLITIEPIVKILCSINITGNSIQNYLSYMSFGKIYLDDQYRTVICYNQADQIRLIQMDRIVLDKEEARKYYVPIYYYQSEYNVIYSGFLGEQNILIVDRKSNIKILMANKFKKYENNVQGYLGMDYDLQKRCVINQHKADSKLYYQIYMKYNETDKMQFNNSIYIDYDQQTVYFIEESSIHKGVLIDWRVYIESLIQRGENWLIALQLILEIYQGHRNIFKGIIREPKKRQAMMKGYINKIIQKYLDELLVAYSRPFDEQTPEQKRQLWNEHILIIIDFLVSVENFQYLFNDIKNKLAKNQLDLIFIQNLEQFILQNKINYIPNEVCREIIQYYQDVNKVKVLQHLIINLRVDSMEQGFIIQLCQEYNLYTCLIYIFTHIEQDFIAPLVKLYQFYQETDDIQVGYKLLWYLEMTFQQKMFPQGEIEKEHYHSAIKLITNWLFSEDILIQIIKIDPIVSFYVLRLFFRKPCLEFIQQEHESLVGFLMIEYKSLIESYKIEHKCIDGTYNTEFLNQVIVKVFQTLYQENKRLKQQNEQDEQIEQYHEQLKQGYFNFMLNLDEKYIIDYQTFLDIVDYFVDNINRNVVINDELVDESIEQNEQKQQKLFEFISRYSSQLSRDQTNIKRLIHYSSVNELYQIEICLLELLGDLKKCLTIYIQQRSEDCRQKVFIFINQQIKSLRGNELDEFLEMVINVVKELVQIDSEATKNILDGLQQEYLYRALRNLEPFETLQQQLLERVLEDRKNGKLIQNNLLLQNIELLCKIGNEKKLMKELKSNSDYPIDSYYQICERYNMKEAMAYLLGRLGGNQKAVKLYLEILEENVKQYLDNQSYNTQWTFVKEKAEPAIAICRKLTDEEECEKMWFLLLDKILHLCQSHTEQKNNNSSLKQLYEVYQGITEDIIQGILNDVQLKNVVNQIKNTQGDLQLRLFQNSMVQLVSNYKYEENILLIARRLITQDILDCQMKNMSFNFKGRLITRQDCYICGQSIMNMNDIVGFGCQHLYHQECFQQSTFYECLQCNAMIDNQIKRVIFRKAFQQKEHLRVQMKTKTKKQTMRPQIKEKDAAMRKLRVFDLRTQIQFEKYE